MKTFRPPSLGCYKDYRDNSFTQLVFYKYHLLKTTHLQGQHYEVPLSRHWGPREFRSHAQCHTNNVINFILPHGETHDICPNPGKELGRSNSQANDDPGKCQVIAIVLCTIFTLHIEDVCCLWSSAGFRGHEPTFVSFVFDSFYLGSKQQSKGKTDRRMSMECRKVKWDSIDCHLF